MAAKRSTLLDPPDSSAQRRAAAVPIPDPAPDEPESDWAFVMGAPALTGTPTEPLPEAVTPARPDLPGYELLEELGRGGMGVVFKARQTKLNRLVALKMIIAGPYAAAEDRARFFAEAETLAKLRHPNIVQIHDFGEVQGHPYFSLEFVDGGTLHRWLHTQKPTPRQAAAVLEPLARALHYAHRQGVIHRDLKPANILLERTPAQTPRPDATTVKERTGAFEVGQWKLTPKVTDFGLAKRQATDLTATGTMLGTPNYMAPEQARAGLEEVTPATDVYGLGAILYELLTGRPPFQGATSYDVIDQVLLREPTRPGKLKPGIPRDLETICLTCLAKQPERRYASAALLADDLKRHLNDEPILARRLGRAERAWFWCRRNPVVSGLLATLLVGFLALAGVAALLIANVGELKATVKQMEQQRGRADANLQSAQAILRELTSDLRDNNASLPAFKELKRQLTLKVIGFYAAFIQNNQDQPALKREVANAHVAQADLFVQLGQHRQAIEQAEKAIPLLEALRKEDAADIGVAESLALAYGYAGAGKNGVGDAKGAMAARERTIALLEPLGEAGKLTALGWNRLGKAHQALATDDALAGRHAAALKRIGQARPCFQKAMTLQPKDHRHVFELAGLLHDEGVTLRFQGDLPGSLAMLREAVVACGQALELKPKHGETLALRAGHEIEIATTLTSMQKHDEAKAAYAAGIAIMAKAVKEHPLVAPYWQRLGFLHTNRANLLQEQEEWAAALPDIAAGRAANEKSLELSPDDINSKAALALNRFQLGNAAAKEKRWDEALPHFQAALALHRSLCAKIPGNLYLLEFVNDDEQHVAHCLRMKGDAPGAVRLMAAVVARREKSLSVLQADADRHRAYIGSLMDQGKAHQAANESAKAVELYHKTAVEFGKLKEPIPSDAFDLACLASLRLELLPQTALAQPTPQREQEEKRLAAEAIAQLRAAFAAGFKKKDKLFTDDDLKALRERPEFAEFCRQQKPVPPK